MRLSYVPFLTALLPAVGIHLAYLVAANAGHVPWCVPYIDGCTSISATGRQGLERFIFRATVIPTAVLMMLYWVLSFQWLKALGSPWRRTNGTMLGCGIAAGVGLLFYATVLGAIGESYQLQRRIGVTLFFGLRVLAQVIMTLQLIALVRRGAASVSRATCRLLGLLCLAILGGGAASQLLAMTTEIDPDFQDAVAWTATLLILLHLFATGRAWRKSGFSARFAVAGRRQDDP